MKKIKKQKMISVIVTVCMMVTMFSGMTTTMVQATTRTPLTWSGLQLNGGDTLDLTNSGLSLNAGNITLTLSSGSATIEGGGRTFKNLAIEISGGAQLTIQDLIIDNSSWTGGKSPINAVDGNLGNTLILVGQNQAKSPTDQPGINAQETDTLIITGSLSSTLTAIAGDYGAGIGGGHGKAANVTITGGTITATGGYGSAGIGGGDNGGGGNVTITGGTIAATGGAGGAGIGGSGSNGVGGNITINGGTVTATGGYRGAGIGGGSGSYGGNISINGGTITATGGTEAAGIGGGGYMYGDGGNITINGGATTATGGRNAAGIGGGYRGGSATLKIVSSANVQAYNDGSKVAIDAVSNNLTSDSSAYLICGTLDNALSNSTSTGINVIKSDNTTTSIQLPAGLKSFATTVSGAGDYKISTTETPSRTICKSGYNGATFTAQYNSCGFVAVKAILPAMIGTVTIVGDTKFGATLTATTSLTNAGTPTYRWNSNGTAISGATNSTYQLVQADIGNLITVTVIADGVSGTGAITSAVAGSIVKADGPAAPGVAPTMVSKTDTSVTLTANALYEYSKDGSTWQDSEVFTGLTQSTAYTFVTRFKETATTNESVASVGTTITTNAPAMAGAVTIAGNTKFGATLTATTSLTNAGTPTYQWNSNGTAISGATNSTYQLAQADIGNLITVTVTADGVSGTGAITSAGAGSIVKADGPAAPGVAPTMVSKTDTSVTLTANTLYEYSKDGSTWQDSEVFTGLTQSTAYTFVTRFKETATTNESVASAVTTITTNTTAMTGTVTIAGNIKFGETLTANQNLTNGGNLAYQWNRNGVPISGAIGLTYQLVQADIGNLITVTITGDGASGTGAITSAGVGSIVKADGPAAPAVVPTIVSKTDTSVTLTANALYEYSKDGITWQGSEVFTGLTQSTVYTFVARVKETATTNESVASAVTIITTNATVIVPPIPTPDPTTVTGNVIDKTGEAVKGVQASITTDTNGNKTVEVRSSDAILTNQPDGTKAPLSDISKLGFEVKDNTNVSISTDGTIKVTDLAKGTESKILVTYDLGNGQKINVSTIDIKVDSNGNVSLTSTLIDPYGIITDESTGNIIAGANVILYYANTDRNKTAGKIPYTVVPLPGIDGFKPGNNKNPQVSDGSGTYGFMVFPTSDYYIVATKDGYATYKSPNIAVEEDLIKWNFKMNKAYTLTYIAGPNGTTTGAAIQIVNSGATGTPVTAVANAGYHFVIWSDGIITVTRTDSDVTTNSSITATFAQNSSSGGGGSSSGGGSSATAIMATTGIITDRVTGKVIAGANVTLYYADTARNKAAGKTAATVAELPLINGVDNRNSQISDVLGAYGFMAFPFPITDYYIVATKDGYEQYESSTISVENQLVNNDIQMTPKTSANGWQQNGTTWNYYINGNKATNWILSNNKWYYLKANGDMATGWILSNGKWYYLKASGSMLTGWVLSNNKWYYLKSSGDMATGWLDYNGKLYYLNTSGDMAVSTIKDGYVVGNDGIWNGKVKTITGSHN